MIHRHIIIGVLAGISVMAGMAVSAQVPHVYINPGHGGHGSDDRNIVVPPFAAGDTAGFWESNSNLKKGFAVQEILRKKGYRTTISRIRNEEANDLYLSTIVALSNASGADVFYSIHSNAVGYGESNRYNYPLGIYRGYTGQPQVPGSDKLASDLGTFLIENKSTVWSNGGSYALVGDWTFRSDWGTQGYGVLRGNNVVSMLSEGSHHDYYPETYRLLNDDYCWVEGWNISLGADRYFGRSDRFDYGIITGNIRDDRMEREATYIMNGDDRRRPVNNATVRLLDDAGNELDVTHTDNLENGIYLFKYVQPGNYNVEVSEGEHFTMTKPVTVTANLPSYCNFDLKRVRDTAPEVVDYSPQWAAGDDPMPCNSPIVLQFNWDMDVESVEDAFSISPAVDGKITWEDSNYRMRFVPDDAFDVNTHYTVTLRRSARHGGGMQMNEDFVFGFTTQERNHLEVLAFFPQADAAVHFAKPIIEFRADSILNTAGLFSKIRVLDKDGNEMSRLNRSIKFNKRGDVYGYIRLPLAGNLNVGEQYVLQIDRDVADNAGLHLPSAIEVGFNAVDAGAMTPREKVLLNVERTGEPALDANDDRVALSSSATALFGAASASIGYDFSSVSDDPVEVTFVNRPLVQLGDTVAFHINGDMSFNSLAAVLVPEGGDGAAAIELQLDEISFHGWKSIPVIVGRVGKYYLHGLKLYHPSSDARKAKQGITGTLLIDDVTVRETDGRMSAIDELTLTGVTVSPNPASEYVVASAPAYITAVELIDARGVTVARNKANYINVSNVPSGVYVMRVYVGGLVSAHKVIVNH